MVRESGKKEKDRKGGSKQAGISSCSFINGSRMIFAGSKTLMGVKLGFPGGSVVKKPLANEGDGGLLPWLGRSHGTGNGNPLQYSCLGNFMGRGASTGSQRVRHG